MFLYQVNQSNLSNSQGLPDWLTSGPVPVILLIIVGVILTGVWVNYRMKGVQSKLGELGQEYYRKEEVLLDDLKSGRLRQSDYKKEHDRLVGEMREDSRKITDY